MPAICMWQLKYDSCTNALDIKPDKLRSEHGKKKINLLWLVLSSLLFGHRTACCWSRHCAVDSVNEFYYFLEFFIAQYVRRTRRSERRRRLTTGNVTAGDTLSLAGPLLVSQQTDRQYTTNVKFHDWILCSAVSTIWISQDVWRATGRTQLLETEWVRSLLMAALSSINLLTYLFLRR